VSPEYVLSRAATTCFAPGRVQAVRAEAEHDVLGLAPAHPVERPDILGGVLLVHDEPFLLVVAGRTRESRLPGTAPNGFGLEHVGGC
jgi:hypothetical protein